MWYSRVRFISGMEKNIIFPTEDAAQEFHEQLRDGSPRLIEDVYDDCFINLENVETITKPSKYEGEK